MLVAVSLILLLQRLGAPVDLAVERARWQTWGRLDRGMRGGGNQLICRGMCEASGLLEGPMKDP